MVHSADRHTCFGRNQCCSRWNGAALFERVPAQRNSTFFKQPETTSHRRTSLNCDPFSIFSTLTTLVALLVRRNSARRLKETNKTNNAKEIGELKRILDPVHRSMGIQCPARSTVIEILMPKRLVK